MIEQFTSMGDWTKAVEARGLVVVHPATDKYQTDGPPKDPNFYSAAEERPTGGRTYFGWFHSITSKGILCGDVVEYAQSFTEFQPPGPATTATYTDVSDYDDWQELLEHTGYYIEEKGTTEYAYALHREQVNGVWSDTVKKYYGKFDRKTNKGILCDTPEEYEERIKAK